jgi:hypothetical protein
MNVHLVKYERSFTKYKKYCQEKKLFGGDNTLGDGGGSIP